MLSFHFGKISNMVASMIFAQISLGLAHFCTFDDKIDIKENHMKEISLLQ